MSKTLDAIARDWAEAEYRATLARVLDVTGAFRAQAKRVRDAANSLAGCGPAFQALHATVSERAAFLEQMTSGDPERRFQAQRRLITYCRINELAADGDSVKAAIKRLVDAALQVWPEKLEGIQHKKTRKALERRLFGEGDSFTDFRLRRRLERRYFTEDRAARC